MAAPTSHPPEPKVRIQIHRRTQSFQLFEERLSDGINLEMMLIPEGSFMMGSPEDEEGRYDNEGPQHRVTVPQFFMSRYPITQEQWKTVVSQVGTIDRELDLDPSHFKGNKHPVERVSWYDAMEFCARLSKMTGEEYRLPSEAEWEYACRAGTTTPFFFGETITTDLANYCGVDEEIAGETYPGAYGRGEIGLDRKETTSIDEFDVVNAFGLSNMHGNVWEWCLDHWHENYQGAPQDGNAWVDSGDLKHRIIRGGAWEFDPAVCRSASRDGFNPEGERSSFGFRVVCVAPKT